MSGLLAEDEVTQRFDRTDTLFPIHRSAGKPSVMSQVLLLETPTLRSNVMEVGRLGSSTN